MSELNNISDQLEAYTEENVDIIKRIAKKNNLTIEQALKATEIATKEMIADCLFHINKNLAKMSDYIENLDELQELGFLSDIAHYLEKMEPK